MLKYCNYHYTNKETKEEEKNTWDQEFVKVDDDTLFSLILVSQPRPSLPPLGPTYCGLQTRSVQTSRSSGRSHDKVAVAATSGTAGVFVPTVPEACQLTHFHFPQAANYLDIKSLLDLTCKTVADYIKQCKTPQEIRRRFNIKNDFTPEEEEEVRKENAWCEER